MDWETACKTLKLSQKHTERCLKKAYYKQALKYHPDKNKSKDAESKFKKINEAYYVLKDKEKKTQYDQFGHQAFENGGAGFKDFNFGGGFSDIFEEMFGDFDDDIGGIFGGRRRNSRTNTKEYGADLRYDMEVSLEEIFSGKKIVVHVPTKIKCKTCDGNGHESNSKPETCPTCEGHGSVRASQGFFTIQQTCPECTGSGEQISSLCKECKGIGKKQSKKKIFTNIPKGVDDGTRIRLSGKGEAGIKGEGNGDLYIFVSVKAHSIFKRSEENLFFEFPISLADATLGATVEVPTIDGGKAKVKIPAGTQNGKQFRLKEKGMPMMRNRDYGDLYIRAITEVPVSLTKEQKTLLEKFKKLEDSKTNPIMKNFFDKAKRFWKN